MIKVAIIGYGGIARVHNNAYHALVEQGYPLKLVAVCDKNIDRIFEKLDFNLGNEDNPLPEGCALYSDVDELIEKCDFDVADVCLPSFLHCEMTLKLLRAGKHVLCEKPMALTEEDCKRMTETAAECHRSLMIGHCLRFSPEYLALRDYVRSGELGELDNIYLHRHSVYPSWGAGGVFNSIEKSGGCAIDTHIHDLDISRFILGEPKAVSAVSFINIPNYQAITTNLYFERATAVVDCSWDSAYSDSFRCGYRARFKEGVLDYDGSEVILVKNGEEPVSLELSGNMTEREIAYFLDSVRGVGDLSENSPIDSQRSISLAYTALRSASLGGEKIKFEL